MGINKILCLVLCCLYQNVFSENTNKQLSINVDERIELLHVIGYLSDYGFTRTEENSYTNTIKEHFHQFSDHELIKTFKTIDQGNFSSSDAPIHFMLHLSENFSNLEILSEEAYHFIGGKENAILFLKLLKAFYNDTNFQSFYTKNLPFYKKLLNRFDEQEIFRELKRIEHYFGQYGDFYKIVISPIGRGNFGTRVATNKTIHRFYTMGAATITNNDWKFQEGFPYYDTLWHEFSHTFTNILCQQNIDKLNTIKNLHDPIKEQMERQYYGQWLTVIQEHMVRAISIRMAAQKFGEDAASLMSYKYQLGRHFIYIIPLQEKLKIYETSRNKYPTLEAFFPELISALMNISEEELSEFQNIRNQHDHSAIHKIPYLNDIDQKNAVVIFPTNVQDPDELKTFMNTIKETYKDSPNVRFIVDTTMLKQKITDKNIIVFGSPENNMFLKTHYEYLPMRVNDDGIFGNLRTSLSWINPYNKNYGMLIYTAKHLRNLLTATGDPLEAYHYQRSSNTNEILKQGKFMKIITFWIIP